MNKKLLYTAMMCAILSQSLVACNGGTSGVPKVKNLPNQNLKNLKNETDNVKGIWGAVTSSDGSGKEGRTDILFANGSSSTSITRVGCVSDDGNMPMRVSGVETISPLTVPKMEIPSKAEWKSYADKNHQGLIYSPLDQQESSLLTIWGDGKGHSGGSSDLTCYYKFDNNIDPPMYAKLEVRDETYSVVSLLMQDIDKPIKDQQKNRERNPEVVAMVVNGGTALFAIGAYKQIVSNMSKEALGNYLEKATSQYMGIRAPRGYVDDFKMVTEMTQEMWNNFANNLPVRLINPDGTIDISRLIQEGDIENILKPFQYIDRKYVEFSTNSIYIQLGELVKRQFAEGGALQVDQFKADAKKFRVNYTSDLRKIEVHGFFPDYDVPRTFSSNLGCSRILEKMQDYVGGDIDKLKSLAEPKTWEKFASTEKNARLKNLYSDISIKLSQYNLDPTFMNDADIEFVEGLIQISTAPTDTSVRAGMDLSRADAFAAALKEVDGLKMAKVVGLGAGFGVLAEIFIMQKLADYFAIPASVGSAYTSFTSSKFTEVTAADVEAWNSSHDPEHQIQANTTVNSSNGAAYDSSIVQTLALSYNDNEKSADKQKISTLTLRYEDTPFIRPIEHSDFDPYYGDVSKGHDKNGNALLNVQFKDIVQQSDSLEKLKNDALRSDPHIGSLIGAMIQKPIISNPSMTAIKPNLDGSLSDSSLLNGVRRLKALSFSKKLSSSTSNSVEDVNGLILPQNGKLSLNVKVDNNTGFRDILYSPGLTSEFISNDEDGGVISAKSLVGYNKLLGAAPVVYSVFTCNAPYAYGSTCNYDFALTSSSSSLNWQVKTAGKLYLSDAYGEQGVQPIFIGYNLILDQSNIISDGKSPIEFAALVSNIDGYDSLVLDGLPKGVKVLSSCDKSMSYGEQCGYKLDFKGVRPGSYKLTVSGKLADKDIGDSDIESITISIAPLAKPN